jgi:2,4-dienoyl-CoA reductase-like NADH-dependent reductase (Old Yellow Enzyme family)
VIARIGAKRTGIRLSPFGKLFDMAHHDAIEETYAALMAALGERRIAYIHVMDQSSFFYDEGSAVPVSARIHALMRGARPHLSSTALILAGGMTRESAEEMIADGTIDLAAFGQPFISNPDLVARLQHG